MNISVIVCTYNGESYIEKQLISIINSLENQDISEWELLIFDDRSVDNTSKIIRSVIDEHQNKNIYFNINTANLGYKKNFEHALIKARGEFIFFSDQDDIWSRDKVDHILSEMTLSNKQVCFSNGFLINELDENSQEDLWTSIGFSKKQQKDSKKNSKQLCQIILKNDIVTGCTLCMKASFKNNCLPFSEYFVHDTWIANIASLSDQLLMIDEQLIYYRLHANQTVGIDKNKKSVSIEDRKKLLKKALKKNEILLEQLKKADNIPYIDYQIKKTNFYKNRFNLSIRNILRNIFTKGYRNFTSSRFSFIPDLILLMRR